MRKFIKNKAHPSLVLVDRSITKEQFKAAWGTCRAGYLNGFIGTDLYYVCDWVSKDRNQPD